MRGLARVAYAFLFCGGAMALSFSFLDAAQTGALLWKRRDEVGSGGTGMGCIIFLVIVAIVAFIIMKNRGGSSSSSPLPQPSNTQGGGSGAAMPNFVNPYDKCPSCGAKGDKMKSTWDGMRKVQWTCGYCGSLAGVQELKDEELPASARARLGIGQVPGSPGAQGMMPGGGYQGGGGGLGNILTGMMIGSMMGGDHQHHSDDNGGFGGSGSDSSSSSNSDWGESGGSGWGDSGSSDSGGGDSGGGDSGGGGDW